MLGGSQGGAWGAVNHMVLPPPPVVSVLHVPLGVWQGEDGGITGTVSLEAANTVRDHRGRPTARLVCSSPSGVAWHDSVQVRRQGRARRDAAA